MNKKALGTAVTLIVFVLLITIGKIAYPNATRIILNIVWFFFLSVVIIFVALGILVILGLKKEVGKVFEMIMEGSFSILDLINSIKEIIKLFIERAKEILLNLAPVLSYILALTIYLLFLYLYKLISVYYDVTILTLLITIIMIGAVGVFSLPNSWGLEKVNWLSQFLKKIKESFADALEVVIFLFFLTMDSTKLIFVPANLNIPIKSTLFGYDFMVRAFHFGSNSRIILTIIIVAILTEIIRNILRLVIGARKYYREAFTLETWTEGADKLKYQRIKNAIRQKFSEAKDDLIKFTAFTTILISGFLFFPRLKLLSVAVASLTSLALDIAIPSRLTDTKGSDLISRIINKVFRL